MRRRLARRALERSAGRAIEHGVHVADRIAAPRLCQRKAQTPPDLQGRVMLRMAGVERANLFAESVAAGAAL
jgi:hypothetical protein